MKVEITHRWSGAVLLSVEAGSLPLALEAGVRGADLWSANLRGADLRGADLWSANLWGADLGGANLRGANLRGADLRDANLWGADLGGANLWGADLRGADLRDANLWGADLGGANLRDANLRGANLRGADLRGANLRDAKNADSVRLDTGETLREYIDTVLPALLTAGGKRVEDVAAAWECHTWENCPMAVAFGVTSEEQVPALYRPRARQFVQLFDANLLPKPA